MTKDELDMLIRAKFVTRICDTDFSEEQLGELTLEGLVQKGLVPQLDIAEGIVGGTLDMDGLRTRAGLVPTKEPKKEEEKEEVPGPVAVPGVPEVAAEPDPKVPKGPKGPKGPKSEK